MVHGAGVKNGSPPIVLRHCTLRSQMCVVLHGGNSQVLNPTQKKSIKCQQQPTLHIADTINEIVHLLWHSKITV